MAAYVPRHRLSCPSVWRNGAALRQARIQRNRLRVSQIVPAPSGARPDPANDRRCRSRLSDTAIIPDSMTYVKKALIQIRIIVADSVRAHQAAITPHLDRPAHGACPAPYLRGGDPSRDDQHDVRRPDSHAHDLRRRGVCVRSWVLRLRGARRRDQGEVAPSPRTAPPRRDSRMPARTARGSPQP